ncbi:MAG TPA: hypothetical protein VKB41_05075 [Steroidobacteraceae bacterium]|nr:hypothetical protein [Steroidobacteraceae bacterium]
MEAETALGRWENTRLFGDGGALSQQGKNALGLPEQVNEEYNQFADEIASGLSTDRQRLAFQKVRLQRGMGLDMTVQRHVSGEIQKYKTETVKANVGNASNLAIAYGLDPERSKAELDRALNTIDIAGAQLGLPQVQIDAMKLDTQTAVHEGVINRLQENDKYDEAEVYFKKYKELGQIRGDKLDDLEKKVQIGNVNVEAQRMADKILADPSLDTLAKQQERAKELAGEKHKGELRDKVNAQLEHQQALKDRAENQREENLLNEINTRLYRNGGDLTSIKPWEEAALGKHMPNIRSFAQSLQQGNEPTLNLGAYYTLKTMASSDDPKQRQAFMDTTLPSLSHLLPKHEMMEMIELQTNMRQATNKAPNVVAGIRSNEDMFKNTMLDAGLDVDSDGARLIHRQWDLQVDLEQSAGKPIPSSRKQEILDDIWQSVILKPGGVWNYFGGGDVTKPISKLTIDDIPQDERRQLFEAVRRAFPTVAERTADGKINPQFEQRLLRQYIYTKRSQGKGRGFKYVAPE